MKMTDTPGQESRRSLDQSAGSIPGLEHSGGRTQVANLPRFPGIRTVGASQ